MSRGQNELIGEFKMVTDDVISIRQQVMKCMYIPTKIKRELVRFGVDCDQKRYIVRIVGGGLLAIHSSGQTFQMYVTMS